MFQNELKKSKKIYGIKIDDATSKKIFNERTNKNFEKWKTRGYGLVSSFLLSQFDSHDGLIEKHKKLFWDITLSNPYNEIAAIKKIIKSLREE